MRGGGPVEGLGSETPPQGKNELNFEFFEPYL